MNQPLTRRTFLKTSSIAAMGAFSTESMPALADEISRSELSTIRYIHIQCNRPDGPDLKGAMAVVDCLAGPIEKRIATGCGDLASKTDFLIHQPLPNGGTAVFTSVHRDGSWGIIRGEFGELELN